MPVYKPPAPATQGVWERATAAGPIQIAAQQKRRRRNGILLGALLGLGYGLVSQVINRFALPGIPLYQPPLGWFGNTVASAGVGAVLGALSCVPNSAPLGIFYASLLSAVAIAVESIMRLGGLVGISAAVLTSIIFSVPFAWLTVPIVALLRWVAEKQAEAARDGAPLLRRARLPAALLVAMMVLASFELLPPEGRSEVRDTDALFRQGLNAASSAGLPEPLAGRFMTRFPPSGSRDYTLEWTRFDLDRFIELRPPSGYDQHAAVIGRFAGDGAVVCLFPTPGHPPNCGSYATLPTANAPARRDD